ncbi:hypothetical protein VNO78_33597 [Psophocarpus tetragonolobus]|uniref:Uncharacterized protein n=1 Tax=Psophocarpus tetragonolobus TaxID=3891 RepID=A0AAN9P2G5_PSOTE
MVYQACHYHQQSMVFISLPPSPFKPTFESVFQKPLTINIFISKISIFEPKMPHFFSHHTFSSSPLTI